jgi:protein involved in polysaccharide export with SLBB domain
MRILPTVLPAILGLLWVVVPARGQGVAPADAAYRLKAGDLVRISVYQEEDLATETRVTREGTITFPLLGTVALAGRSVLEVKRELEARLGKEYLVNPQVTLTVVEYVKERVTVLGQVQSPGTVEIPQEGRMDVLGAIAKAGGYTRIADPGKITVRRTAQGKDEIIRLDGRKLARDAAAKPFEVRADDVITVGESLF